MMKNRREKGKYKTPLGESVEKAASQSSPLPAVQCKDTLLLDYDHSKTYSKRQLGSNWNKYDELPDEEENQQVLAADFQQILLAPQSVGSHFTFRSEKHWEGGDRPEGGVDNFASNSQVSKYFKLNLAVLRDGVGKMPFYLRQGYAQGIFNELELDEMNKKVTYFEDKVKQPVKQVDEWNQGLFDKLIDGPSTATVIQGKTNVQSSVEDVRDDESVTSEESALDTSLGQIKIQQSPKVISNVAKVTPSTMKTDTNMQQWLDDILNE